MSGKRVKVMLVDDNMTTLLMGKNTLQPYYEVYPIPSAQKLFEILDNVIPEMILLDVEMPEMNGYEVMRKLKQDLRLADIPVIFLTSQNDEGSELKGLSLGAIDYVSKPFSPPLLLKRIENHLLMASQKKELKNYNDNLQEMVRRKTAEVVDLKNVVLTTLSELVEFRDGVTGGHISRTQEYLRLLVAQLAEKNIYQEGLLFWDLNIVFPSSQLHDVGKIAISDMILNKPGKLTAEEFQEMKKHTLYGVEAIERIERRTKEHDFLKHAKLFALSHHEKWDGTGYPKGLKETEIPLQGRLMALADVYDALLSERPYKKPFTREETEHIILEGRGTHFDPALVDVFFETSDAFAAVASNKEYDTPTHVTAKHS